MIGRLGWKPPLPNLHKPMFAAHFGIVETLPPSVDLRPGFPLPPYDQGNLGSCTANAAAGLAHFLMKKLGVTVFMPSRLAEYYWTRVTEGTESEDAGASVADAVATMGGSGMGIAHESMWWYNVAKFAVKPNAAVVADAKKHHLQQVLAVNQTAAEMKTCLSLGFPIDIGFTVYESFDNIGSNGIMPMPQPNEQVLGGHSVLITGYDDSTQYFTVRNSWGTGWGDGGYFYMPFSFAYNSNAASDFWTANNIVYTA